jgi:hypothetical protein
MLNESVLIIAGLVSLSTIIGLFVKLTWWLSKEFSAVRKLIHENGEKRDARITRLEYWAVLQRSGFQPSADPLEFNGKSN